MSATVIDKLTVELGLDPKEFKKGTAEATKATKDTQESVTKSATAIVTSLRRVAAEFVSLFLVVRSVKDVVGIFSELNASTRQLGIDSRNYGESAAHLRDWGNIAEMAGGQAEDATGTIAGLQKAIFDVGHGLGWSSQLTEFGRIGVDTGVATGKMRDFHDLLLDTSRALQTQFPDKATRFQETRVLGLQGGIANAVSEGPDQLEKYYQQQLKIHQTTEGDTRAAAQLAQAWDLLRDKMRALTTQILTAVSPAIQGLFTRFGNFLTGHQQDFEAGIKKVADWASGEGPGHIVDAFIAIGDAAFTVASAINSVAQTIAHPIDALTKGGVGLRSFGNQAGDDFRKYKAQYEAEKKYGLPEGILRNKNLQTNLDPEQAADALTVLHDQAGGDKGDPNWNKTADLFKQQYGPVDTAKATAGATASPRAQALIQGKPTANNLSGRGTNVRIDSITVNTAATDANGIARDLDNALSHRLNVTLADGALS